MRKEARRFFGAGRTLVQASAPGRMDVMGGFGDYSGSWVLQMPIAERTTAWLAWNDLSLVRVHSVDAKRMGLRPQVELPIKSLANKNVPANHALIRKMLQSQEGGEWAAYVLGCFAVLSREKELELPGADVWIESQVPFGKGVSSSAALEVSVMTALASACEVELGRTELPLLAQKVENEVVGAPCGLMDQLTSSLGEKDRLLPILCQPDQVSEPIPIPKNLHFVGIDSGVRHAVSGSSYVGVRTAAFMGCSIIARLEGASRSELKSARESGDWSNLPYQGYLANIPPSVFETKFRKHLPAKIRGKDFAKKFGKSIDAITKPNPRSKYDVLPCVAHPVYENHRVRTFSLLLQDLNREKVSVVSRREHLEALGEMMYQAHASYTDCQIGNEATDALVEAVRKAGPECGVYGAKITGGGSGGSVCVLCEGRKGIATARAIAKEVAATRGHEPLLFIGSSDGALKTKAKQIRIG